MGVRNYVWRYETVSYTYFTLALFFYLIKITHVMRVGQFNVISDKFSIVRSVKITHGITQHFVQLLMYAFNNLTE